MTDKHKHEISEGAMRSTKKRKKRAPETKKRKAMTKEHKQALSGRYLANVVPFADE